MKTEIMSSGLQLRIPLQTAPVNRAFVGSALSAHSTGIVAMQAGTGVVPQRDISGAQRAACAVACGAACVPSIAGGFGAVKACVNACGDYCESFG